MKIEALPPERWSDVAKAYSHTDEPFPAPEHTLMLAAMDGEKIVGVLCVQKLICASPLWIAPEYRGNGIAEGLANEAVKLASSTGMQGMVISDNPFVEKILYAVGMIPLQGTVWRMKHAQSKRQEKTESS